MITREASVDDYFLKYRHKRNSLTYIWVRPVRPSIEFGIEPPRETEERELWRKELKR